MRGDDDLGVFLPAALFNALSYARLAISASAAARFLLASSMARFASKTDDRPLPDAWLDTPDDACPTTDCGPLSLIGASSNPSRLGATPLFPRTLVRGTSAISIRLEGPVCSDFPNQIGVIR